MLDNAIANAIKSMSMIESFEARNELEKTAKEHNSVESWKSRQKIKSSSVGFGTGLLGGPWGVAMEALDLSFLLAQAGRGCYGVGHIKNKDIDYEADIALILAIWAGVGETAMSISTGKVAIKIGGSTGLMMAAHSGGKLAGKVVAKSAVKGSSKLAAKIMAKAAAKLSAKIVTKAGVKWLPVIGGVVSAGVNAWVMDGLISAAEQFYSSEYLVLAEEIAHDI